MQFLPYKTSVILSILFSFFVVIFSSQGIYAGSKTITINFNENDIKYSKQKEYDVVSLPKFGSIYDSSKVGEPMMPKKTIWVLLPSGTEVTNVRIVSTKEKQLDGQYYIYPIQYPGRTGDQEERKFVEPKKGIYASNESYPGKSAEFYYENYFRDYHIAEISIYPLQYKPAQQKLTLNTEISIEIKYSASSKYKPLLRMRQNVEKQNEMAALVKKLVINPEDISLSSSPPSEGSKLTTSIKGKVKAVAQPLSISYSPSATEGQDVNYIIITVDSLVSSFQRLADWKTKKGVVTTIKSVSWISQNYAGSDLQEKIRYFIHVGGQLIPHSQGQHNSPPDVSYFVL